MRNKELFHDLKHSFETLAKIFIPVGAAVATGNPLLAAGTSTFFIESFFGVRNRLKMERVERFLNDLDHDLKEVKISLERTEKSFADSQEILEKVLISVSGTRSEIKLLAFKKILVCQLLDEISFDKAENYLELIETLGTQEIILLKHYYENERSFKRLSKKKRELNKIEGADDINLEMEIAKLKQSRDEGRLIFKKKYSEGELQFIVSSLVSRGLVLKGPGGNGSWYGDSIFNDMNITDFGCEIIEFIKQANLSGSSIKDIT